MRFSYKKISNSKKSKEVKIGKITIGGNNPIRVQSMCNTDTKDIESTVNQIIKLEKVGCEIVRISVPDINSAKLIKNIKKKINIPLVADIHYDYKVALECLNQGIDKIRINPGNISKGKLKIIAKAAKKFKIPIRIGVNIGSLPKDIIKKWGNSSKAMVESAFETIKLFEKVGFYDIVVSLKSSNIFQTIEANILFSKKSNYPIHLGITEAGITRTGMVKSSIGIGYLLINGIGDTIRVSLSADPVEEVLVGYTILKSLGLRKGVEIISCPTCGRAKIDVIKIANELERKLIKIEKQIKIGILGCFVNIQEAKIADLCVVGSEKYGLLFRKGKLIKKINKNNIIKEVLKEINKI